MPDYFHARNDDTARGRFFSIDSVLDQKLARSNPQAWNGYVYVRNNPMRYVDPTGKYTCTGFEKSECGAFNAALIVVKAAAFEAARTGVPGATRLADVVKFYGKLGQDNGVHVVFGSSNGSAQTNLNKDGSVTITVDRSNFVGISDNYVRMANLQAHEADHGLTLRDNPEVARSSSRRTFMALERSAYRTQSYVNRALGIDDSDDVPLWTRETGFSVGAMEYHAEQSVNLTCQASWCSP